MARRKRTRECAWCGRRFVVCRYNPDQKYCLTPACVGERRRERQRKYYKRKYRDDASFREAEQARCRAGARRRREQEADLPEAVSDPDAVLGSVDLALVTAGLVSQLIDSEDRLVVAETTRSLERRGLELAVSGGSARASPF